MQDILADRKHFTHLKKTPNEFVDQVNTDSGRYYKTPTGALYPSVTTVVGLMNAKEIEKWRNRVGQEEAAKIAAKAASRGTRIHQLCEDYINNSPIVYSDYGFQDRLNFTDLKPILDNNLDSIHLQETRLYSDYLQLAGTVDCVAEWKGKLAIIDFKTAKKPKNREYIKSYFCQAAAYAIMYEERFGIPVSRTVIIISVDDEPVQVFEERRDNYVKDLLEVRQQYRDKFNM
jgi:genome maintenance exonuclease 1